MRFRILLFLAGSCVRLVAETSAFQGLSGPPAAADSDPYQTVGQLIGKGTRCTGTLISPYVVLTAAHCVWKQPASTFTFTVDRNPFWNGESPLAKAREIRIVPTYRKGILQELSLKSEMELNDIALVYLESATYGLVPNSFLAVSSTATLFAGKDLMAPGYGVNENKSHSQFRVLNLSIARFFALPDEEGRMIPSALFGMAPLPGKSNACHGDSGGPLLFNNAGRTEIVAVASAALYNERAPDSDNCSTSFGTIYTNVFHHRDWIAVNGNWDPSAKERDLGNIDKKNLWKGLPVIKKGK